MKIFWDFMFKFCHPLSTEMQLGLKLRQVIIWEVRLISHLGLKQKFGRVKTIKIHTFLVQVKGTSELIQRLEIPPRV